MEGIDILKNLEDIRNIIDDCDKKLVEIFEQRLKAVLDVLEYKKAKGLPIFQPKRERDVFKKVNSYLKYTEFSNELDYLYTEILKISKKLQSKHLFPFNIVLIGFMGSGKSSIGKELSTLLEMDYIDTDELIIEKAGMSIDEVFNIRGEIDFRKLEKETIEDLQNTRNTVISCGGGVVLNTSNIDLLKNNGKLIWLKASSQEIYSRLSDDSSRPLLKNNLTIEKLSEILNSRLFLYEGASDIAIHTDGKSVQEIATEIVEKLLS